MVLVAEIGADEHDNCCSGVRRCRQHLGFANRKPHVRPENDWEEVCQRISLSCQAAKLKGKHPDFPVCTTSCPLSEIPLLGASVVAILVDTANDKLDFLATQKLPVILVNCDVREVDQEDKAEDSREDR